MLFVRLLLFWLAISAFSLAKPAGPCIFFKGKLVSGSSAKTISAITGQQLTLSAEPAGGTWSFETAAYANFTGLGAPPSLPDPAADPVSFYWATAGTKSVTYTVNGEAVTVALSIAGATGSISTTYLGKVQMLSGFLTAPIQFSAHVVSPVSGKNVWVQVIQNAHAGFYDQSGTPVFRCRLEGNPTFPALDQHYPYPYSPGDVPAIQPPATPLAGVTGVHDSSAFRMYLLWQPSGVGTAYPVPLAVIDWDWSGVAEFLKGHWQVNKDQSYLKVSSTGPTADYPEWKSTAPSGNFQCEALPNVKLETRR